MITPVNLQQHYRILKDEGISLPDLFTVPTIPLKEKLLRKFGVPIARKLPIKGQYLLTSAVKRFRNPTGKLKLNYPLDFPECQIIAEKVKEHNLKPWWGKRAVVCVSHDVDNSQGLRFVTKMADIDSSYDLPSTFNFLTHDDYEFDNDLIRSLIHDGFEVGLHGYTHDQGFAFRNPKNMKKLLQKAGQVLFAENFVGYRSPALSVSEQLFQALGESNFLYDSSLQIASPFYHSVRIPFPFYMDKYGIWELPLMVQDDNYFRDTNTPEDLILESITRFINEIIELNGVFVINFHPHLMIKRENFYKNLIKTIKAHHDVAFATMEKVIEYAKGDISQ